MTMPQRIAGPAHSSRPRSPARVVARTLVVPMLVIATCATAAAAASAEIPTPTSQAVAAHAEFLAYAPPPPTAAAACFIDSGLHQNPDTQPVVLHSEALDPAQTPEDTAVDLHGSRGVMTAFAPINGWGAVGIWPGGKAVTINALAAGQQSFPFSYYRLAISRCIRLSTAYPIRVIVLSLGAATDPDATQMSLLADAVDHAHAAGINVIAAAGNGGGDVEWPAAYPPVLAVGAADAGGALCPFSARGSELDVQAPGCPVQGAFADSGEPAVVSGTSTADDLDGAALDALRSYDADLSWQPSEQLLRDTAHDGNIDVRAAFEADGLGDVVEAGERAAARAHADATGTDPPPSGTSGSSAPRRLRTVWPTPVLRWRRVRDRLRLRLRRHPSGAKASIAVQRSGPRGTVRTVARSTTRAAVAELRVPRTGRIRLVVFYLADSKHLKSRVAHRTLR